MGIDSLHWEQQICFSTARNECRVANKNWRKGRRGSSSHTHAHTYTLSFSLFLCISPAWGQSPIKLLLFSNDGHSSDWSFLTTPFCSFSHSFMVNCVWNQRGISWQRAPYCLLPEESVKWFCTVQTNFISRFIYGGRFVCPRNWQPVERELIFCAQSGVINLHRRKFQFSHAKTRLYVYPSFLSYLECCTVTVFLSHALLLFSIDRLPAIWISSFAGVAFGKRSLLEQDRNRFSSAPRSLSS